MLVDSARSCTDGRREAEEEEEEEGLFSANAEDPERDRATQV